jgi:hypothetical protein
VINVNEELLLECADLSALWSAASCRSLLELKLTAAGTRRQVAGTKAMTGHRTPKVSGAHELMQVPAGRTGE